MLLFELIAIVFFIWLSVVAISGGQGHQSKREKKV